MSFATESVEILVGNYSKCNHQTIQRTTIDTYSYRHSDQICSKTYPFKPHWHHAPLPFLPSCGLRWSSKPHFINSPFISHLLVFWGPVIPISFGFSILSCYLYSHFAPDPSNTLPVILTLFLCSHLTHLIFVITQQQPKIQMISGSSFCFSLQKLVRSWLWPCWRHTHL